MSSQKKSSRLEGKDLITIGIYTVIYVVIVMLVAMLGFIPIFIPLMAVLCPLIGGIPYMLYVTKAKKFGMTAIMGFLIGLIMVFFGNGYLTMVTGLVGGLLADVILKKADYKSAKSTVLSCGVFSIWVFGNFAPIFLNSFSTREDPRIRAAPPPGKPSLPFRRGSPHTVFHQWCPAFPA